MPGTKILHTSKYAGDQIEMRKRIEYRCPYCRTLQFIGYLGPGTAIEIKCRSGYCKRFVKFGAM